MADRNLALQLLITAKDTATSVFTRVFSALNDSTNVVATKVREAFAGIFDIGSSGAAEFEAALSKVAAKGDYTAAQMAVLKQAAIDIGARFGVSGTEAAQGMEALAAAGLTATQTMQALPPVLALAKAEGISMDAAAEKLSDSLSTVGLGFDQAARMADVLAKGANVSTTSASALAAALATTGGIAHTAGLSLEEIVGNLSALANAGIKGERAGTALQAILTQLINPASQASKELSALGITSRNLGDVIGALAAKGTASNAAILAFGETAGPGLRALISQGQTAIGGLTQQLGDATGAAEAAAKGVNDNLKGALTALSAAWENVKAALLDPVLQPIAEQARALADTLNQQLSAGALKPLQDAIKSFATNSAQSIADFVKSFDFSTVLPTIQDFAQRAGAAFDSIRSAGQTAADVVSVAWNGVSAGVKTVGAALLAVASSAVANLAVIEEAASKVGLGSLERATALQEKANALAGQAAALTDSIARNGESIQAAFERLAASAAGAAGGVSAVADAQKRLKDSAPTVEIQSISRSMGDLQGMAAKANAELERAKTAFWDGKGSLDAVAAAAANAASAEEDVAAAAANAASAEQIASQQRTKTPVELQAVATAAEDAAKRQNSYTDAVQKAGDAQTGAIRAEIALAQAKGDTVTVATKTIELARVEAATAEKVAAAKQTEASSYAAVVAAQQAYLDSIGGGTQAQQQELQTMQLKLAAMQAEAVQAGATAEQLQRVALLQLQLQQIQQDGVKPVQQLTQAQKEQQQQEDASKDAATAFAQVLGNQIKYWQEQTEQLSAATRALFELRAGLSSLDPQFGLRAFSAVSAEAAKSAAEIARLNKYVADMRELMLYAAGDISRLFASINAAGASAQQSYYEQKLELQQLEAQIARIGDTGGRTFASVSAAIGYMQNRTDVATSALYLLNDQDLKDLRSALADANDKLQKMQDEAQSAKDKIAELNAEIAAEKGDQATSDRLKTQLEQRQALAEAEKNLADAQQANNRELIALYQQQIDKINQLYDLKLKNLAADAKTTATTTTASTTSTSATSSSGTAAVAKTFVLQLQSPSGKTFNTTSNADPSAFLSELEQARLRSA